MHALKQDRRRMFISIIFALLAHGLVFIVVQYLVPIESEEVPEYRGSITVLLNEPLTKVQTTIEKKKTTEIEYKAPEEKEIVPTAIVPVIEKGKETVLIKEKPLEETIQKSEIAKKEIPKTTENEPLPLTEEKETVAPPKVKPKTTEENVNETTIEEPLALNLKWLDEAIKKSKESESISMEGIGKREEAEEGGTTHGTESPMINWEDIGNKRQLISKGELPKIPEWVKEEGLNLRVVVFFSVAPEGHTVACKISRSSGYSDVDASVLESVRKLKFNPISGNSIARGRITYIISPK